MRDVMSSWRINFWDINFLGVPSLEWYYEEMKKNYQHCLTKILNLKDKTNKAIKKTSIGFIY